MIRDIPRGLRFMAAAAFAFSIMSAVGKVVGQTLPLFELVFGRSLVVAALAGFALKSRGLAFRPREPRLLIQRGVFGFLSLSGYFYSIIHLPLADATVIYFMNPVLTALAAGVVLGEHMVKKEGVLVGVSLIGVVLVAKPSFLFGASSALAPWAVAAGVCAATFGAGSYVTIRQVKHDPPLLIVFVFSMITLLLAAPLMISEAVVPSLVEVLLLIVMGSATHVGQLLLTWGLRLERAGRASSVGYLQIVLAAAWGWVLFGDIPDAWTWTGAVVIALSTLKLVRLRPIH